MGPGAVVVGTGFGCLTHVRALRAAGFDVAGLVGQDPERTAQRAKRFEVPVATTSFAEALALPGVDAVSIATPPHTHARLVLEAVAAGKHVVCEKPFARDAAEARTMQAAADAAGVVHLLGTEFRWAPGQALMTRLVKEGAIGEPRLATFLLSIPLLAAPDAEVPEWWSDAGQGGGWFGAQAAHVVDQIRTTLGEIDGVAGSLPHVAERGWTAEDSYVFHFRTRGGCAGTAMSTASDWGPIQMISRVVGTAGTVWAEGDRVRVATPSGTSTVPVPADLEVVPGEPPPADLLTTAYDLLHSTGIDLGPYTRLYGTFRALIAGESVPADPAPATFSEAVADMEVMDAVRASAAAGTWVSL